MNDDTDLQRAPLVIDFDLWYRRLRMAAANNESLRIAICSPPAERVPFNSSAAAAPAHREQRLGNANLEAAARAASMLSVSHRLISFRCV